MIGGNSKGIWKFIQTIQIESAVTSENCIDVLSVSVCL